MTGTDNVDHVEIMFDDQPVEVDVKHIEPRRRSPMPEQPRLDVIDRQRLFEQRVLAQIDLADRQIIRRTPVGMHAAKHIWRERTFGSDDGRIRVARSLSRFACQNCDLQCPCHVAVFRRWLVKGGASYL